MKVQCEVKEVILEQTSYTIDLTKVEAQALRCLIGDIPIVSFLRSRGLGSASDAMYELHGRLPEHKEQV